MDAAIKRRKRTEEEKETLPSSEESFIIQEDYIDVRKEEAMEHHDFEYLILAQDSVLKDRQLVVDIIKRLLKSDPI